MIARRTFLKWLGLAPAASLVAEAGLASVAKEGLAPFVDYCTPCPAAVTARVAHQQRVVEAYKTYTLGFRVTCEEMLPTDLSISRQVENEILTWQGRVYDEGVAALYNDIYSDA